MLIMTMRTSAAVRKQVGKRGSTISDLEKIERDAMAAFEKRAAEIATAPRNVASAGEEHVGGAWAEIEALAKEGGSYRAITRLPHIAKRLLDAGPPPTRFATDAMTVHTILAMASDPNLSPLEAQLSVQKALPALSERVFRETQAGTPEHDAFQSELAARAGREAAVANATEAAATAKQVTDWRDLRVLKDGVPVADYATRLAVLNALREGGVVPAGFTVKVVERTLTKATQVEWSPPGSPFEGAAEDRGVLAKVR
jgi:hypothetical protein